MASAAECVRFERESFGALHQMLAGLPEEGRRAAWEEIEDALGRIRGPGRIRRSVRACRRRRARGRKAPWPGSSTASADTSPGPASDDEVIALIQDHMRTDHPELVGKVSRADLEGWIQED